MRGFPWARFHLAELPRLLSLPRPALLVFAFMVQRMDEAGMVYATQKQLQKLSGLSRSAVARSVQALKAEQVIDHVDKRAYRINPRYVQVGRKQRTRLPGLIDLTTGEIKKFKVKRSNQDDSRISLATET